MSLQATKNIKKALQSDFNVRNYKYIQLSNVLVAVQPYFLNTISLQRVSYVITSKQFLCRKIKNRVLENNF